MYQGPPGSSGPPGPGTPIMPSPQDSSNSGGENMYTLMKPVSGGSMGGVSKPRVTQTEYTLILYSFASSGISNE